MLSSLRIPFMLALLPVSAALAKEPAAATKPAITAQELSNSELVVNGKPLGQPVAPRSGEVCVVCKRPLGTEGMVYLINGQRLPLHLGNCYSAFAKDPQKFFAILQPHGAFLGTSDEGRGLSWAWFLAGLYVLLGLVFAALCAHRALNAGRNPAAWFAAGLLLNALGFLWLLTRPRRQVTEAVPEGLGKVATTYAPLPCPACGALNHPAADRCAACGNRLESVVSSEVEKVGLRSH